MVPLTTLFLALAAAVGGEPSATVPADAVDLGALDAQDREIMRQHGYLEAHPDRRFQRLGYEARKHGQLEKARGYFRRAARYADKLSQGAYAEMLWNGEGGVADRALAYAWMDLAAERGAPLLAARREHYWAGLSPDERKRAVHEGQAVYAEYGDEVAKPRLELEMRRHLRNATGSRVGKPTGLVRICLEGQYVTGTKETGIEIECKGASVDGSQYYADKYWMPGPYWRMQDRLLSVPETRGNVEVGAPRQLTPGN